MSRNIEFVLDKVEANVIGTAFGVDLRRPPLRLGNTTTDSARLITLARRVTGRLTERGLVVRGELHPNLRTAFRLFDRHRVSVSISGVDGHGADIAALTLTDGAQALGVTQYDGTDELLFALFSDDDLIEILVGVLPPMPAAPGTRTTVRKSTAEHRSALAARRAAEREFDDEETEAFGNFNVAAKTRPAKRRNRSMTEDERLREALAGNRLGEGRVTVHGDRGGSALSWVDTEAGRYLVHTEENAREFVAHYEPAGHDDVVRAIRNAVSAAY